MTRIGKIASGSLAGLALVLRVAAAQESPSSCAAHSAHAADSAKGTAGSASASAAEHHAGVDERGDHVMGFDHAKTTHHFLLARDGGSIEIKANSANDAASRDAIRSHLPHIAKMFAGGDFTAPMLIHDRVPPGVPVLSEKKSQVRWRYEELPSGGRVVASTKDPEALAALHEFLRFQISDHRTGDPGTVPDASPEARRPAGTGSKG